MSPRGVFALIAAPVSPPLQQPWTVEENRPCTCSRHSTRPSHFGTYPARGLCEPQRHLHVSSTKREFGFPLDRRRTAFGVAEHEVLSFLINFIQSGRYYIETPQPGAC